MRDDPRHLTLEWRKADRGNLIFVDVNRNAYAQHAVAPYGVRAKPRAPVAMPLHWEELSDGAAQARPLDGEDDRRPRGRRGRPVEGHGAAGAQAAGMTGAGQLSGFAPTPRA